MGIVADVPDGLWAGARRPGRPSAAELEYVALGAARSGRCQRPEGPQRGSAGDQGQIPGRRDESGLARHPGAGKQTTGEVDETGGQRGGVEPGQPQAAAAVAGQVRRVVVRAVVSHLRPGRPVPVQQPEPRWWRGPATGGSGRDLLNPGAGWAL